MRTAVLCLVILGASWALNTDHILGMKALLRHLDQGVFPTCTMILFSEFVDYETAEERCSNFDIGTGAGTGNLATVNDEDKNQDIRLLLKMAYTRKGRGHRWESDQWVWAGMRKTKNNDGSRLSKTYNNSDWEWVDGSHPGNFSRWMRGQPDQRRSGKELQNQMRINHDGRWDDTFKFKTHPYACDYQGKYLISATLKSWSDAKEVCNRAGLTLAMVRNDAEVQEIVQAANRFLGPWNTTLKTFNRHNWIWLGGSDADQEGTWTWTDGSPVENFSELNWRDPMPDNAEYLGPKVGSQNYMAISRWGEFDDSYDTGKRRRPFACQCPGT